MIRVTTWLVYVALTVLLPMYRHNDLVTMVILVLRLLIRKRYLSVQPRFKIRGMILIFLFTVGSDVFFLGNVDKETQAVYGGVVMVGAYKDGTIQFTIGFDTDMRLIQFIIK